MGQSKPKITISTTSATVLAGIGEHKVLIVGQKLAAGTAIDDVITEDIDNTGQETTLFGAGSMLETMVSAFKDENKETQVDVYALADASGTKAVKTLAFTGTASAAGQYIININDHEYTIDVANLDTATVIGDALVAAITADTTAQWTAVNSSGSVAITSKHFGTVGTGMTIKVTGSATSVTYTITATTPGATDPTLDLVTVIGNRQYQTIIFPFQYGTSTITTFLESRFNINNKVLYGSAVTVAVNTKALHVSAGGKVLNKKTLEYWGVKLLDLASWKGSDVLVADYELASRLGALRALRLTTGADLTGKVIAGDRVLDVVGGVALSSKPYFNTPVNIALLDETKTWSYDKVDDLEDAQVNVVYNNDAVNAVIMGTNYTTYTTDIAGNVDITYSYQNFVDTIETSTEFIYSNLKSRYAQMRLVNSGALDGEVDEAKIKTFCVSLFDELAGEDYLCLDPSSKQDFLDELTVVISKADRKATITGILPIVSQLAEITAVFQISLD